MNDSLHWGLGRPNVEWVAHSFDIRILSADANRAELQQAGDFFDLCCSMSDSDGAVMCRTVGVPGLYEFSCT